MINITKNYHTNIYEEGIDEELRSGIVVEMEHQPTYDWLKKYVDNHDGDFPSMKEVSQHIAMDHLREYKDYYTRLATIINDVPAVKTEEKHDGREYSKEEIEEAQKSKIEKLMTIHSDFDETFDVWIVDGEKLRKVDNSFSGGMNHNAGGYTPEGELWVEQSDNLPHEFIEFILEKFMKEYKIENGDEKKIYPIAHKYTSMIEGVLRQIYDKVFEDLKKDQEKKLEN